MATITSRGTKVCCYIVLLTKPKQWTCCWIFAVEFSHISLKPHINLELECIFWKPMNRWFQRYIVRTEILSTFHAWVKYISVKQICHSKKHTHTHIHTTVLRPSWILSGTTWVSQYQKGKTRKVNQSGFTEARKSEWQWHQQCHMQICTSTQTNNDASIPPLSFL